jgi:hypothetical protein
MYVPIGGIFIFVRFTQWIIHVFRQSKEAE